MNGPPPPLLPDRESRVSDDQHESLRLWLRLLTCTLMIERSVRTRLRDGFDMTLPRFDLMAQLERHPEGLRMGEVSRRMMVTGGNVTGIADQLVAEGLVGRMPARGDRRALILRLTPKGKRVFDKMARAHEQWVVDMLAGMPRQDRAELHALLGRLKQSVAAVPAPPAARTPR